MGKLFDNLKYHVVDSTSMSAEFNPVFAAMEVGIAGMSDSASLNARMLSTSLVYGGLGRVFSGGRDISRRIFNVTQQTKEKVQATHDVLYGMAFNLLVTPPMYMGAQVLAGEPIEPKQIFIGTGSAMLIGGLNAAPMGYVIDVCRDLTGIQECKRPAYSEKIKGLQSKTKAAIFAGFLTASAGLMSGVYLATDDQSIGQNHALEQTIETTISESEQR